jgi:Methyltransferase domain
VDVLETSIACQEDDALELPASRPGGRDCRCRRARQQRQAVARAERRDRRQNAATVSTRLEKNSVCSSALKETVMNAAALKRVKSIWRDEGIPGVIARGGRRIRRDAVARFYWYVARRTASLSQLAETERTDKADAETHMVYGRTYLDVYEQYLHPLRNQPINLLEIGVLRGKSVRLWKRYFPKAHIFGVDIDPACQQYEEARISIEIGSQADVRVLERLCGRAAAPFDVVIDDGSHINRHIIATFTYLFPRLKPGGIYIIEDLGCSYGSRDPNFDIRNHPGWPGMHYNDPHEDLTNRRAEMDAFFNRLIADLDHLQGIQSVHFWPWLCIITKAAGSAESSGMR